MNPDDRPRLRADLEILLAETGEEPVLILHDPEALAIEVAQFGVGVLPILELLDGSHAIDDMRAEFLRKGQGVIEKAQLENFVALLDRCLFLDNENAWAEREARAEFLRSPVRAAAHAGQAYPAEPEAARSFMREMLANAESRDGGPLARLIAPHIDLKLGAPIHAAAHRALAAAGRPDVVVVLGVRHDPARRRFIACRKDFATPLGTVQQDAALLDAIEERFGEKLTVDQLAHRHEHSIEFQALWLAHHWPGNPPAIVPLLVGSFGDLIDAKSSPAGDEEVERFIRALREAIAADSRRVVVLASVDFCHVGPIYEDEQGLDEEGERALELYDRDLLESVVANDAEAFFAKVASDGNARHVCGAAPVYVTLRLAEGKGDLIRYGQGRIHPESGSVVSYAAVAFAD